MSRIAFVTCEPRKESWDDDVPAVDLVRQAGHEGEFIAWDDPDCDWRSWDLVINRSTWDYTDRLDEYLAWTKSIEPGKLRNPAEVIHWNTDKRYLADLDAAGLPVPPTMLVAPGDRLPDLHGEFVVKPTVGGSAQNTGRFSDDSLDEAAGLISALIDSGETAMIQPYLDEIETHGETAIMAFNGRIGYSVRKKAFLAANEVAPLDDEGVAVAMSDEGLVTPSQATPAELDLAARTLAWLGGRFGVLPLFARIDMVQTRSGPPVLMEVELTEPSLYLSQTQSLEVTGAEAFADAILEDLTRARAGRAASAPNL